MRKTFYLAVLTSLFGLGIYAQEGPRADLTLSYSFLRVNSAQTIPAFTANGGMGTFAWNLTNMIGIEAELGGYHNGNINNRQVDTTFFSYLFGPRLSWGRSKRIDPYIHTLFGGQNTSTSISKDSVVVVNPLIAVNSSGNRYSAATNNFAMAIGGGLDIKLTHTLTLRPAQIDYYLSRIEAINVTVPPGQSVPSARNQNNFRYAAGLQFTFGGAQ